MHDNAAARQSLPGDPPCRQLSYFSSLSAENLQMTRDGVTRWQPRKPGIEFKNVEGASTPPADSAVRRLVQMRNIAPEAA